MSSGSKPSSEQQKTAKGDSSIPKRTFDLRAGASSSQARMDEDKSNQPHTDDNVSSSNATPNYRIANLEKARRVKAEKRKRSEEGYEVKENPVDQSPEEEEIHDSSHETSSYEQVDSSSDESESQPYLDRYYRKRRNQELDSYYRHKRRREEHERQADVVEPKAVANVDDTVPESVGGGIFGAANNMVHFAMVSLFSAFLYVSFNEASGLAKRFLGLGATNPSDGELDGKKISRNDWIRTAHVEEGHRG